VYFPAKTVPLEASFAAGSQPASAHAAERAVVRIFGMTMRATGEHLSLPLFGEASLQIFAI